MRKKIIIAGPCAAESRNQVITAAKILKSKGVKIMRASLWKPRTNPGFDGVGERGIPWLAEVTKIGLTVASEVLFPEQVSQIIKGITKGGDPKKGINIKTKIILNYIINKQIVDIKEV